jgi:deoxyhypusine monooxygenase
MRESDFNVLAELEEAFERKDLKFFVSMLNNSRNLPLLLRVHSVCMLEQIWNETVVPALCRILKEDPSPLTRHEAAFTLGQVGFKSTASALVEAMVHDPSPIVRHESAVALSSLGDASVLPDLEKAIKDPDEDVSNSALIAWEYLSYLTRKKESVKPDIRL